MKHYPTILLLVSLFIGLFNTGQATQKRYALIIGNAAYKNAPLANPTNDAIDMTKALQKYGFKTTRLLNASKRDMEVAIEKFTRMLGSGDKVIGLFYYAGHGIEIDGQNYLIPVDATITTEVDAKYDSVNAGRVLDGMTKANNGLNLVVLDACRNNPFKRGWRSSTTGLAEMRPASGTLVFYATEPRKVAADGTERNGLFTKHLLKIIDTPGLEVKDAFQQVALGVRAETGGRQIPWSEGMIFGRFYFAQSTSQHLATAPATGMQSKAAPKSNKSNNSTIAPKDGIDPIDPKVANTRNMAPETSLWLMMQNCGTSACLQAYLDAYPKGRFASAARALLAANTSKIVPTTNNRKMEQSSISNSVSIHNNISSLDTGSSHNTAPLQNTQSQITQYLHKAQTHLKAGRLRLARLMLEQAEEINPDHPEVIKMWHKLRTEAEKRPFIPGSRLRRFRRFHPDSLLD